jgi:hypothetical protein
MGREGEVAGMMMWEDGVWFVLVNTTDEGLQHGW